MIAIRTRIKVAADGNVIIPVGKAEAGSEVDVVVTQTPPRMTQQEWEAFVNRTAGSITDPTFVRPPQGEYEVRIPLDKA